MDVAPRLPVWAPRVKQALIRAVYQNDAAGMTDESLLDEAGWALRARCQSFITACAAARGSAACPVCDTPIPHHGKKEETLTCPACGWQATWGAYFATFQHQQLSGAEPILKEFQAFVDRFPLAREPREKMLLIDALIHAFHWNMKYGNTRAAGVNLIEGNYHQVVDFLDALHYGADSTPGLADRRDAWRKFLSVTADQWGDERLRKS